MSAEDAKVTDPVCGMTFPPARAAATHTHQGRTFYFCATSCRDRFRASPESYLGAAPPAAPAAPASSEAD